MKKIVVFDLPTRIFHGVFALGTLGAYIIAQLADQRSGSFAYHSLLGMWVALALIFRLVWGVMGSRYARFSSFTLAPSAVISQLKGAKTAQDGRVPVRGALSSWAALGMLLIGTCVVVTGISMLMGASRGALGMIHEVLANIFVVFIIVHVVGLVLEKMNNAESSPLVMLHGKANAQVGISSQDPRTPVGMVYLGVLLLWATYLFVHYDINNRILVLFGHPLQMVELELVPYRGNYNEELIEHNAHVDEAVLRKRREDMLDNIERRKKLRAEERERALEGQQR